MVQASYPPKVPVDGAECDLIFPLSGRWGGSSSIVPPKEQRTESQEKGDGSKKHDIGMDWVLAHFPRWSCEACRRRMRASNGVLEQKKSTEFGSDDLPCEVCTAGYPYQPDISTIRTRYLVRCAYRAVDRRIDARSRGIQDLTGSLEGTEPPLTDTLPYASFPPLARMLLAGHIQQSRPQKMMALARSLTACGGARKQVRSTWWPCARQCSTPGTDVCECLSPAHQPPLRTLSNKAEADVKWCCLLRFID